MVNSDQQQARLSALVRPREGRCLNVMDSQAIALQEQHRRRYDTRLSAPSKEGLTQLERQTNAIG